MTESQDVTLRKAQRCVADFHERMKVSEPEDPETWTPDEELEAIAREGLALSERLLKIMGSSRRRLRAHLELEETCEFILAMARAEPGSVLDAKADQLYVLLGSAETFGLPLTDAFIEVHSSNMTKEKQPDDPHADRVRQKGPNYRAPQTDELYVLHAMLNKRITRAVAADRLNVPVSIIKSIEYLCAYSSVRALTALRAYAGTGNAD